MYGEFVTELQDIVRVTFKAFHDVLRAQGDTIKALERNVDTKAGRAEMSASLQQKANSNDMAGRLREVRQLAPGGHHGLRLWRTPMQGDAKHAWAGRPHRWQIHGACVCAAGLSSLRTWATTTCLASHGIRPNFAPDA